MANSMTAEHSRTWGMWARVVVLASLGGQNGNGKGFRELLEAAQRHGFHMRPYATCIKYAPPSNRTRMLFTIWTKSKVQRQVRTYIDPEAFAEFYPVKAEEAVARLGPGGRRRMTYEQMHEFIAGLDSLMASIPVEE